MAKKRSTRSRLIDRAAKGGGDTGAPRKGGRKTPQARAQGRPSPPAGKASMSIGGLQIPGLQLDNVEDTVRNVVSYVQQNPLAAAAVALGAGVMLTSMYWEGISPGSRGSRR